MAQCGGDSIAIAGRARAGIRLPAGREDEHLGDNGSGSGAASNGQAGSLFYGVGRYLKRFVSAFDADDGFIERHRRAAAFQAAQQKLQGALSHLLVVNEKYPDLKANQAYHDLQIQLEGTENRVLRSREEYNAAVADFNTELGKIRGQVVNKVTGQPFKPRLYFSASSEAQSAPKVSF